MHWIDNPLVWVVLLPALAVTGLLSQMVASLFTCCGTFRLRGRSMPLKWWMIPAASLLAAVLWIGVVFLVIITVPSV